VHCTRQAIFLFFFNRVITYRKKIIDTRMDTSAAGEKIFYPLKQTLYGPLLLTRHKNADQQKTRRPALGAIAAFSLQGFF